MKLFYEHTCPRCNAHLWAFTERGFNMKLYDHDMYGGEGRSPCDVAYNGKSKVGRWKSSYQ